MASPSLQLFEQLSTSPHSPTPTPAAAGFWKPSHHLLCGRQLGDPIGRLPRGLCAASLCHRHLVTLPSVTPFLYRARHTLLELRRPWAGERRGVSPCSWRALRDEKRPLANVTHISGLVFLRLAQTRFQAHPLLECAGQMWRQSWDVPICF